MQDFNIALLGKQGLKLFTDPNALVSRIYDAKYYRNGDFLNATLGHRPSYAWQSIISSHGVIKSGYRWCIANGSSINLLTKSWIWRVENCYLETVPTL
ncbi:hypothetical protein LINGRAHAP2_LOCUS5243 [Linum grandiflorum]